MQMLSASRQALIHPFTALRPAEFRKLVRPIAQRGRDAIAGSGKGLPPAERSAPVDERGGYPTSNSKRHTGSAGLRVGRGGIGEREPDVRGVATCGRLGPRK